MQRPQNYAELRQQARDEVQAKIDRLEERAENLKKFLALIDEVTDRDSFRCNARETGIWLYGDDDLPSLIEIADNWPDVALPPGMGGAYWG